jgi:hypothetical protein
LGFNYLAFLREVVDCSVLLLEAEGTLGANVERRTSRVNESAGMIRAVEELGAEAASVVEPIAKEQPATPAGRCAAAIAKAIKEAVAAEIAQARAAAATNAEEIAREDQQARASARTALEKLLRAHDLPGAEEELEAAWTAGGVKAKLRQRTKFGIEAVLVLEIPAGSTLAADLRVDRIAEGLEVHVREAGRWLKKSDKLVAQKLGRHAIVGITTSVKDITIQLRAPDTTASLITFTVKRGGDIAIDDGGGREYELEDRDRAGLKQLAEKLDAALGELSDKRSALEELTIDGKPFAEHAHPRTLAERLITAIAPTVQTISRHSRSPGELVLRRQLADDRREEVFISIGDLVRRMESLPVPARAVFAPLQLGGDGAGSAAAPAPAAATLTPSPPILPSTPEADAKLAASINAALADD